MYAITAQRPTNRDGFEGSESLPMFYLDERTQSIVSEDHACRIAADILGDVPVSHIFAVKV